MPIRFQADADFNHIVVAAVLRRLPQADFRTAIAGGLAGLTDLEVLAVAARDGRILLSHDQTTMPRHFGEFIQTSACPGVIIVPQTLAVRDVVDSLILISAATQPEEWINRIAYLPILLTADAGRQSRRTSPRVPVCSRATAATWARTARGRCAPAPAGGAAGFANRAQTHLLQFRGLRAVATRKNPNEYGVVHFSSLRSVVPNRTGLIEELR